MNVYGKVNPNRVMMLTLTRKWHKFHMIDCYLIEVVSVWYFGNWRLGEDWNPSGMTKLCYVFTFSTMCVFIYNHGFLFVICDRFCIKSFPSYSVVALERYQVMLPGNTGQAVLLLDDVTSVVGYKYDLWLVFLCMESY